MYWFVSMITHKTSAVTWQMSHNQLNSKFTTSTWSLVKPYWWYAKCGIIIEFPTIFNVNPWLIWAMCYLRPCWLRLIKIGVPPWYFIVIRGPNSLFTTVLSKQLTTVKNEDIIHYKSAVNRINHRMGTAFQIKMRTFPNCSSLEALICAVL